MLARKPAQARSDCRVDPRGRRGAWLATGVTPAWAGRAIVGVGVLAGATLVGEPLGLGVDGRAARARRDRAAAAAAGRGPARRPAQGRAAAARRLDARVVGARGRAGARAGPARGGLGRRPLRCSSRPRSPRWPRPAGGAGASCSAGSARCGRGCRSAPCSPAARRRAASASTRRGPAARGAALRRGPAGRLRPAAGERRRRVRAAPRGRRPDRSTGRSPACAASASLRRLAGRRAGLRAAAPAEDRRAPAAARCSARSSGRSRSARWWRCSRAFVALQLTTLFGGNEHVLETAGLTYAAVRALGLLAAAGRRRAHVRGDRRRAALGARRRAAADALLAALCLLTLVVLASALKRLGLLRGDATASPALRFAAHAALLWLRRAVRARARRALPRRVAAAGDRRRHRRRVLAFALADPERRIADANVERYERTGQDRRRLPAPARPGRGAGAARASPQAAAACVEPTTASPGFNLAAEAAARRTRTAR